jgi:hypothetical protein
MGSKKKKMGIVLDLDDVLVRTSYYSDIAIRTAIDAMIYEGLPTEKEECHDNLMKIRKQFGSNYFFHFDRLCESYALNPAPQRIVQAGVSAYHSVMEKLLTPSNDNFIFFENLINLGIKPCIVTSGREDKQWYKIHRLGIARFFEYGDRNTKKGNANDHKSHIYICEGDNNRFEGKRMLVKRAIYEMDIYPEISFVVDDRPYGIGAAKMEGIKYGFRYMDGTHMYTTYEDELKAYLRPEQIAKIKRNPEVHNLSQITSHLEDFVKHRDFVMHCSGR